MMICESLVFISAFILCSIELSSQFDCLPDGTPIPGVPRRSEQLFSFPNWQHSPCISHDPARSSSPVRPLSPAKHDPPCGFHHTAGNSPVISSSPARNISPGEHDAPNSFLAAKRRSPDKSSLPTRPISRVKNKSPGKLLPSDRHPPVISTHYARPLPPGGHDSPDEPLPKARRSPGESSLSIRPISPSKHNSPGRSLPTVRHSPVRCLPAAEPPLRNRSRSPRRMHTDPPIRLSCVDVVGYRSDQLEFIRLTSFNVPRWDFRFQRYTFPVDKPIKVLEEGKFYRPISSQEHIVLSKIDGDVFAILEKSNFLAGIYAHKSRTKHTTRAKINMGSGTITPLTKDEMKSTPVGCKNPILSNFRVEYVDPNLSSH